MMKVLLWFLFCHCRLLFWIAVVVMTKWSSWSFVSCSWITANILNRCDWLYDGFVVFDCGGLKIMGASFWEKGLGRGSHGLRLGNARHHRSNQWSNFSFYLDVLLRFLLFGWDVANHSSSSSSCSSPHSPFSRAICADTEASSSYCAIRT